MCYYLIGDIMKKNYIKMNDNDDNLSLGNLFRIIKELSRNKSSALQSDIFCTLFDIESINDTTVNNYCVGCRSIGGEYKQIYLNKNNRYKKNKKEFVDNIIGILSIIDGNIYVVNDKQIEFINHNTSCEFLVNKLYNLAKNDKSVKKDTVNIIKNYIHDNKYYEALIEELLFIVLYKNQPVYEENLKKEVLDNILSDTSISSISLQEYLSLKLREGINYDYSLKKLANNGNAYANFEMGTNEYYGYYSGYPRYDYALKYLLVAANLDHAGANYMIGNMYIKGLIGSKSREELNKGYKYLLKAYNLGNVAASNMIGNMYYEGIYPLNKDIEKAIYYYKKASEANYVYAFNNLGKIYEEKKEYDIALKYYLESADLGESWACNKVGEYYRKGIVSFDMNKAYLYYNKALDSNYRVLCYYAYYNLAIYFYLKGYDDIVPIKDKDKAINYLTIASDNGCYDASISLFYLYIDDYLKGSHNIDKINSLKRKIESDERFNNDIKNKIEKNIVKIKSSNNEIDLSSVL